MREGRVSYCFFCGAAGPAGGTCETCLVPVPDPYRETAEPVTVACPRCTSPLLAIGIAPATTVHACARCHGVLVGARAWCTVLSRPELAQALQARLPARAAPPSELVRLLRCPLCATSREMERGRFGASSNIVIDVCTMHGIWLDGGEVAAVVQHSRFREKVGRNVARNALNRAEGRASPEVQAANLAAALVMESARLDAHARPSNARRNAFGGAIGLALALLLARLVFYVVMGRSDASPTHEVENAGQSAGSAATALGPR